VDTRWRSFKKLVGLWVDLFDRHSILTYASAIALRMFIAAVACTLFGLGILGATHERRLWQDTIGPQIKPKVLPAVFDGGDQTVHRCSRLRPRDCSLWPQRWPSGRCPGSSARRSAPSTRSTRRRRSGHGGSASRSRSGSRSSSWPRRSARSPSLAGCHCTRRGRLPADRALGAREAPSVPLGGSALVVVGWIGETLIFGWYVRSFADFRTPVGSLEMFIFLATYFYVAAIVLLVAMQELLPLVTGVIRG